MFSILQLLLSSPDIFLRALFANTRISFSIYREGDHVSHPYKTGKMIEQFSIVITGCSNNFSVDNFAAAVWILQTLTS
jgi:hypothetical protein